MDTAGNKAAHTEIQAIKIATPSTVEWILDKAIKVHGAGGLSQDFPLAEAFAMNRTLRFADGPDEVHEHAALAGAELSGSATAARRDSCRVTREGGPGQVVAPTSRQRRLAAGPMPLPPPSAGVSPSSRRCRHGRRARSTADRPRA